MIIKQTSILNMVIKLYLWTSFLVEKKRKFLKPLFIAVYNMASRKGLLLKCSSTEVFQKYTLSFIHSKLSAMLGDGERHIQGWVLWFVLSRKQAAMRQTGG